MFATMMVVFSSISAGAEGAEKSSVLEGRRMKLAALGCHHTFGYNKENLFNRPTEVRSMSEVRCSGSAGLKAMRPV
jgi:hypothetical protein